MNLWLTVYRLACVLFALLLVIAVAMLFVPKLRLANERARRAADMEEENRAREEAVARLRQQQQRFATDPKFVERVAREELGKARPGETVFRFIEPHTNTSPAP